MPKTISKLKSGESIRLKFHGSKMLGNDAYELDVTFISFKRDNDNVNAIFDIGSGSLFEACKMGNRWVYGSSAERLSVVS